MAPFKIELYRGKYNGADHERNKEATRALFNVLAGGAPLQGKPGARTGNNEEQRHTPGKEESLNSRDDNTLIGVLDVPGSYVEYIGCMEEEDSQYCQYA